MTPELAAALHGVHGRLISISLYWCSFEGPLAPMGSSLISLNITSVGGLTDMSCLTAMGSLRSLTLDQEDGYTALEPTIIQLTQLSSLRLRFTLHPSQIHNILHTLDGSLQCLCVSDLQLHPPMHPSPVVLATQCAEVHVESASILKPTALSCFLQDMMGVLPAGRLQLYELHLNADVVNIQPLADALAASGHGRQLTLLDPPTTIDMSPLQPFVQGIFFNNSQFLLERLQTFHGLYGQHLSHLKLSEHSLQHFPVTAAPAVQQMVVFYRLGNEFTSKCLEILSARPQLQIKVLVHRDMMMQPPLVHPRVSWALFEWPDYL